MHGWCAAPPVAAHLVAELLPAVLLEKVGLYGWVYPLYTRLAMGSSHSVYILMTINMAIIGRSLHAAWRWQRIAASTEEEEVLR